jgi:hypothetical protein
VLPASTSDCSTSIRRCTSAGASPLKAVQHIQRAARGAPRELLGQLDALRLAARERGRRLAQADVTQATACSGLQPGAECAGRPRMLQSLVHRQVQHSAM